MAVYKGRGGDVSVANPLFLEHCFYRHLIYQYHLVFHITSPFIDEEPESYSGELNLMETFQPQPQGSLLRLLSLPLLYFNQSELLTFPSHSVLLLPSTFVQSALLS